MTKSDTPHRIELRHPDGSTSPLLIVRADSAEDALAKLDGDPFMRERVIADRSVREWTVVIGQLPGA